ncbi:hypothetical protein [Streptomyces fuscigenes]|uniref:hypothetical protein n=1 Tax=Streptomyces fuscigenes TaxID=1528880 RepID=UPI001F366D85|nr:hypothetical protein [Streptomyces fuscigenes]MCF3960131.1 hypothetical protein [Streptomyces fuscigenes]
MAHEQSPRPTRPDDETRMHRPGKKVPVSGIYECTCGQSHRYTNTDVTGKTFPPPPEDCSGVGWNLKEATLHQ